MTWHTAPKYNMATKNEMAIVEVIRTANLEKMTIWAGNRKTPQPKVVIAPLRMLLPISWYECFIFSLLVFSGECM